MPPAVDLRESRAAGVRLRVLAGDRRHYQLGIPEPLRDAAARLYDDAFLATGCLARTS